MKPTMYLLLLLLTSAPAFAQSPEITEVLKDRNEHVKMATTKAIVELKALASAAMADSDAKTALLAHKEVLKMSSKDRESTKFFESIGRTDVLESLPQTAGKRVVDELAGSKWDFLGTKKQKINGFVLNANGTVRAESVYNTATWTRVTDNTIFFRYSTDAFGSCIVFHIEGTEMMKGYQSKSGAVRYLRRVK